MKIHVGTINMPQITWKAQLPTLSETEFRLNEDHLSLTDNPKLILIYHISVIVRRHTKTVGYFWSNSHLLELDFEFLLKCHIRTNVLSYFF